MFEGRPILAPVAGASALAISLTAVVAAANGTRPAGPLTWGTVTLGAAGGLIVLLWPQQISALAIADALVAASTVASTFSLGVYELVPLVLLGAATLRTPHRPARTGEPHHAQSASVHPLGVREVAEPQRRSA